MDELEIRRPRSTPISSQRASGEGAAGGTVESRDEIAVTALSRRDRLSRDAAVAACAVGVLYAGVSVYWGLGGTWLLDTVGGPLARAGRAHSFGVIAAVWGAAVLKLIAAVLPLVAVYRPDESRRGRAVWVLAWISAAVLIVYGLVLTVTELLAQTGVLHVSSTADHRALAWHAYLWDPWFLIWGILIATALLLSDRTRRPRQVRR